MKILNSCRSEVGFSIIQVMVAIALTAGLALSLMQISQNQSKQQKTMELKGELYDIANIIRESLRDREACEATFSRTTPGQTIDELKLTLDFNQPPFAVIGQKFKGYNVFIKEMRLLTRPDEIQFGKREVGQNPMSYTTGVGYGYLKIIFIKQPGDITQTNTKQNFFGAKETAIIFPIKGLFYDYALITAEQPDQLLGQCYSKAFDDGVTCTGAANEPCSYKHKYKADGTTHDTVSNNSVISYLGECKYYRDESPLQSCFE